MTVADSDYFQSDFPKPRLESADLGGPGGKLVTLTIRRVTGESTDDAKPKQVMTFDPIAWIVDGAGKAKTEWLYGITVARYLAAMFGPLKSGWLGKRVTIHSEMVEAFGEMAPALRPIGSPDIEKAVTFTVPKGRGKVKVTMKPMVSRKAPSDPPAAP
jgi:hypothetical protein